MRHGDRNFSLLSTIYPLPRTTHGRHWKKITEWIQEVFILLLLPWSSSSSLTAPFPQDYPITSCPGTSILFSVWFLSIAEEARLGNPVFMACKVNFEPLDIRSPCSQSSLEHLSPLWESSVSPSTSHWTSWEQKQTSVKPLRFGHHKFQLLGYLWTTGAWQKRVNIRSTTWTLNITVALFLFCMRIQIITIFVKKTPRYMAWSAVFYLSWLMTSVLKMPFECFCNSKSKLCVLRHVWLFATP